MLKAIVVVDEKWNIGKIDELVLEFIATRELTEFEKIDLVYGFAEKIKDRLLGGIYNVKSYRQKWMRCLCNFEGKVDQ